MLICCKFGLYFGVFRVSKDQVILVSYFTYLFKNVLIYLIV